MKKTGVSEINKETVGLGLDDGRGRIIKDNHKVQRLLNTVRGAMIKIAPHYAKLKVFLPTSHRSKRTIKAYNKYLLAMTA